MQQKLPTKKNLFWCIVYDHTQNIPKICQQMAGNLFPKAFLQNKNDKI